MKQMCGSVMNIYFNCINNKINIKFRSTIISMAAVIRLKRHLDDEPLEALVINSKRQKRNNDDDCEEQEIKTLLKFAGTINNQDDDLSPHISRLTKNDLEKSFKKHTPNVGEKLRQQTKDSSQSNRFKVVNLSRSINPDIDTSLNTTHEDKLNLTVLDIETENVNGETKNEDYVFDLYYTNSDNIGDTELENIFSVCPANEELVYSSYRDIENKDSDVSSEDSNDENNWRNEYPDEDDQSSIDEDDIRDAIGCLKLDHNDLSSDEGEEGFVYSIDSEAAGFEEELDQSDVRRYGELYARFKARQKKEEEKYNKDLYNDEVDDANDEYYD